MVHHFYMFMRLFPFIAVVFLFAFVQVGIHFRRRKDKLRHVYFGLAGFCLLCMLLWIGFRGDRNADHWVKSLLQSFRVVES